MGTVFGLGPKTIALAPMRNTVASTARDFLTVLSLLPVARLPKPTS
jgi:hypothetical protein